MWWLTWWHCKWLHVRSVESSLVEDDKYENWIVDDSILSSSAVHVVQWCSLYKGWVPLNSLHPPLGCQLAVSLVSLCSLCIYWGVFNVTGEVAKCRLYGRKELKSFSVKWSQNKIFKIRSQGWGIIKYWGHQTSVACSSFVRCLHWGIKQQILPLNCQQLRCIVGNVDAKVWPVRWFY